MGFHFALQALHDYARGAQKAERNLADDDDRDNSGGIAVNNVVIVSQHGGSNFTSIGQAIEFAPLNSKVEDGYFIIYAMEGIYEEYITIPKHKKNIMLLGVGINRTVITGNHSYVDGWSTFNSATFSKT